MQTKIPSLETKSLVPSQTLMAKKPSTLADLAGIAGMSKGAGFPVLSEWVSKLKGTAKTVPALSTPAETFAKLEAGRAIQETAVNKIAPPPSTREMSAEIIRAHEEKTFAKHRHTEPSILKSK